MSEAPEIVVTGRIPDSGLEVLRDAGELWAWGEDDPIPVEVRNTHLATDDAAVTLLTDRVDDSFLDAAPGLRIVANVGRGHEKAVVADARLAVGLERAVD